MASTFEVHWPQDDDALVWLRTSSSVVRPLAVIALVIAPLQTPLQPQISASSDSAATAGPRASPVRGLMPPAMTPRSAGRLRPSLSRTASTLPLPRIALVSASV